MGRRCCIAGCNSCSRLPEHQGVTYHSFPLDSNIRAIWMRNARISSDRQITKSVLVCSRHFRRADFHPQRSGKYLLKQRVFPTVFPWGKIDPTQMEEDLRSIKPDENVPASSESSSTEDTTKATVEAKVAQIMAEAAELNAAASSKATSEENHGDTATPPPLGARFEAVTNFNPGVRLEAQDFDGNWHIARIVEVDNDDREVLIKFERSGKTKSAIDGSEEWIPMNSTRLRQKISNKPIPVFALEEKCMARWTGPRKFPGTVKKILSNDTYEVLFDDGYVKNVRAVHMNKVSQPQVESAEVKTPEGGAKSIISGSEKRVSQEGSETSTPKKRQSSGSRRDWPLLDLSKLDLETLNLPEIPRDGEWTCHWVNDQPIGKEGFLVVGEHRKPTVIVEDWRLPPGWIKHMYQRSNVLGKWDVILVSPGGKRFRSKSDLKLHLEEQGQVYNPDIYDFSIHRRRAKDINAYVFTPEYTPQRTTKPQTLETSLSLAASEAIASSLASSTTTHIETPVVVTAVPPLELMTTPGTESPALVAPAIESEAPVEDGYAYIGGLKVQIVDNLFRCPQEGCTKNFRKEDHLQIHVKHYHGNLTSLLGSCPKMQELAEKRTHIIKPEVETTPKNQIPNQQFFAKLHQQDIQHTRSHRKVPLTSPLTIHRLGSPSKDQMKKLPAEEDGAKDESQTDTPLAEAASKSTDVAAVEEVASGSVLNNSISHTPTSTDKRARFTATKAAIGARKSSRQRATRNLMNVKQSSPLNTLTSGAEASFSASDFEETRHSFNATPDSKASNEKKKKPIGAAAAIAGVAGPATPSSGVDSPITADSSSVSFQPLMEASSNEQEDINAAVAQTEYIKENGELIKIVHMRQEEIINCLCGYGEEDGLMIQCELCLCWQHGICNGIDKESDVPDKYVCYICRNPQRGRESMRYVHDQDWLYEGKLPVANYHTPNPTLPKRFELLKKSHTLTGNLIELKNFMHSLRVKISIANNRSHPKLYLWAKKWDDDSPKKSHSRSNQDSNVESPLKKPKLEEDAQPMPNVPQPEAPIDPEECQQRLLEHIKNQQILANERLNILEAEVEELERQDELTDLKDSDMTTTKETLASYIRDLEILKQFANLNQLENLKEAMAREAQMQSSTMEGAL